jgi:hypothetical protein
MYFIALEQWLSPPAQHSARARARCRSPWSRSGTGPRTHDGLPVCSRTRPVQTPCAAPRAGCAGPSGGIAQLRINAARSAMAAVARGRRAERLDALEERLGAYGKRWPSSRACACDSDAHTIARAHTGMHVRRHDGTQPRTRKICIQTPTHPHTHTRTHTRTQARATLTNTQIHTHTHAHRRARARARTHARIRVARLFFDAAEVRDQPP